MNTDIDDHKNLFTYLNMHFTLHTYPFKPLKELSLITKMYLEMPCEVSISSHLRNLFNQSGANSNTVITRKQWNIKTLIKYILLYMLYTKQILRHLFNH